jgi:hypothetical protein
MHASALVLTLALLSASILMLHNVADRFIDIIIIFVHAVIILVIIIVITVRFTVFSIFTGII